MTVAAVPVHQLFHKHNVGAKTSATELQLNKFEKPCCKVFEGVSGDIVITQPEFKDQPLFGELVASYFQDHISGPFFYFSNKAPPVKAA